MKQVFITGSTGYIGSRLIKELLNRGHKVTALVRKGSEQKVPQGAEVVTGDPFDKDSFQQYIPSGAVFIQLLGVSHPSPEKANQFREIDLKSVKASADAAAERSSSHFIYISVAMVSVKFMKAYQDIRKEGEAYCLSKNFNCTFIRPWYVLGPGHWWPVILLPFYGIAELVPSWRKKAKAMGLVSIKQMIRVLINAVESLPEKHKVIEVADIKKSGNFIST